MASQAEDNTWLYAVQISAQVQASPPQIALTWLPDQNATKYTIYRKSKDATEWGLPIAEFDGAATNYTDADVQVGTGYEYQIVKKTSLGYTGYGYIYSAIELPMTEDRGKLVLVVETNATASLAGELARLQQDLVGDGWTVIPIGVSSNDTPAAVRARIIDQYRADPATVDAVFLFGHVPILESGDINYDGHLTRPMPADAYYGDMNDDWPTNSNLSPSYLPSDVQLMVGRVDFFNLPGLGAPAPWPSETDLLRNYLDKDHNWRQKLFTVPRLALMGNSRGDEGGIASAASGYRVFTPLVGPGNIVEANVSYNAPPEQRWTSMLGSGRYLWAYGCGGGAPDSCGGLGTHTINGVPGYALSTDVVGLDAHAVFVMLFGSWFGQWDLQDDFMRAFLATPSCGLACCLSGQPHWFLHHMGLGEPIGYSTRLTMNNSNLYRNEVNLFPRAAYIALMGDPTLRMEPVAPPTGLTGAAWNGDVVLNWSPSADPVLGYYVYRASDPAGPFSRLTSALLTNATYTDQGALPQTYTYMVRAVLLQTNPSGSYFNPSEDAFTTVNAAQPPPTIDASVRATPSGPQLTWDSEPGLLYHVLANDDLTQTNWTDVSGAITANNSSASWTDTNAPAARQRFYRITSAPPGGGP